MRPSTWQCRTIAAGPITVAITLVNLCSSSPFPQTAFRISVNRFVVVPRSCSSTSLKIIFQASHVISYRSQWTLLKCSFSFRSNRIGVRGFVSRSGHTSECNGYVAFLLQFWRYETSSKVCVLLNEAHTDCFPRSPFVSKHNISSSDRLQSETIQYGSV